MVAYWLPKEGTEDSEWEDGAAYSRGSGWFAVADGASTGANSREWAFSLTRDFISAKAEGVFDKASSGFVDWLQATRDRFDPHAAEFARSKAPEWVQAAGAHRGAHATLLAGRLTEHSIDAIAVGDCCLFHLRPDRQPTSFPLQSAQEFGTSPDLIASRPGGNSPPAQVVHRYQEVLNEDDVVLVASDALAEWLIRNIGDPDVRRMLTGIGHRGFRELCRDLRATGQLKNDDVTMFRARTVKINRGNG